MKKHIMISNFNSKEQVVTYLKNKRIKHLEDLKNKVIKDTKILIINIGSNDSSRIYINQKVKLCEAIGIEVIVVNLEAKVTTDDVIKIIENGNKDPLISGIFVQIPIPKNLEKDRILNAISPEKDLDALTNVNMGKIINNEENHLLPCTVFGIFLLLEDLNINVEGKTVLIIGRSQIVGRPLIMELINRHATVLCANSYTTNLEQLITMADIIISATGHAFEFKKEIFNQNQIILDVGIQRKDKKVIGDFDYDYLCNTVKFITPVPGGIGPYTILGLINNIIRLKGVK